MEKYGGKPGCIIAQPDINVVKISEQTDFILLGSDGIFDQLSEVQIKKIIQTRGQEYTTQLPRDTQLGSYSHLQQVCGACVNSVLQAAMDYESTDNLSVVLLLFKNFQDTIAAFDPPIGVAQPKIVP